MRSRLVVLLVVGFAVGCEQSSDPVSSVGLSEAEVADSLETLSSAKPTAGPLVITANLTQWGTYRHIPDYARILQTHQTYPYYGQSIQYIDGNYYNVSPLDAIMKYKGRYYLVPRDARFTRDKYGQFCGGGWGNNARSPINDGGLDAACKAHDQSWSNPRGTNVRRGDREFLAALRRVAPRWQYEYDYVRGAKAWMECRVRRGVTKASWTGTCGWTAFSRVSTATISRIVRR